MASAELTIVNKLGLHARASAKLTQVASSFKSEVWLSRNGRRVNAKSIMGVMMLAAGKGASITVEAEGADADAALARDPAADRRQVRRRRMNFVLHGSSVASGITIGQAHLVSSARLDVAHYEIPDAAVPAEIFRFDAGISRAKQELALLESQMPADAPAEFGAFINLHRMILEDSSLSHAPRELIRERKCNAEWALVQQMETLVEQFEAMEDPYLRERKADIQQVVERVLKALMGDKAPAEPQLSEEHKLIVVAHDLSPADMILFKRHEFGGFVTDVGGVTSHTAIVARSLDIPALVGLHHARHMIREGELLIVDGTQGVLIVDPDPIVLAEYQLRQSQHELERKKLRRLKTTPAATLDGARGGALRQHRAAAGPGRSARGGRAGRGPVPHRVPVHEPQGPARRGRAVRGLPRSGEGDAAASRW